MATLNFLGISLITIQIMLIILRGYEKIKWKWWIIFIPTYLIILFFIFIFIVLLQMSNLF